jgi:hypothetical protein
MLADQFLEAATSARITAALDETARLIWAAHGEGHLNDTEAKTLSEAIEAHDRPGASQGFQKAQLPETVWSGVQKSAT